MVFWGGTTFVLGKVPFRKLGGFRTFVNIHHHMLMIHKHLLMIHQHLLMIDQHLLMIYQHFLVII